MKKFVIVLAMAATAAVIYLTASDESTKTPEEYDIIRAKLHAKGYRKVTLGSYIPSSDSAFAVSFRALDPLGHWFDGTALLWRDELRVYSR